MTHHDDDIRLRHMLDHAREARSMVQGKSRADLQRDRMLELALVRLIEVVGEAAARVSPDGCNKYSRIPWPEIVGMRNLSGSWNRKPCEAISAFCLPR